MMLKLRRCLPSFLINYCLDKKSGNCPLFYLFFLRSLGMNLIKYGKGERFGKTQGEVSKVQEGAACAGQ